MRGAITSPTFVIARVHPSVSDGPALVHVDAYRLGGIAELDDLDLDTDIDEAVTVVEWGEGLAESLSATAWSSASSGQPTTSARSRSPRSARAGASSTSGRWGRSPAGETRWSSSERASGWSRPRSVCRKAAAPVRRLSLSKPGQVVSRRSLGLAPQPPSWWGCSATPWWAGRRAGARRGRVQATRGARRLRRVQQGSPSDAGRQATCRGPGRRAAHPGGGGGGSPYGTWFRDARSSTTESPRWFRDARWGSLLNHRVSQVVSRRSLGLAPQPPGKGPTSPSA